MRDHTLTMASLNAILSATGTYKANQTITTFGLVLGFPL